MARRFYGEWTVGDSIDHEIPRTVTETDNVLFSTMTHNPQPLHLDAEAARASKLGQIVVNGTRHLRAHDRPIRGRHDVEILIANLG